jgi:hypothetical protein
MLALLGSHPILHVSRIRVSENERHFLTYQKLLFVVITVRLLLWLG